MSNIDTLSVNALRILSADAVQKANSGHPGLPLGAAPMAYELWANHMNHNPGNPEWVNRDRFILSAGHGSSLLYSLLHLFGYGNLSVEDLKQFRQWNSVTPGHPEYGHTPGVEATTGPLGAGMGMAVGMAIAEAHLAEKFNRKDFPVVDHYTFVLGGDGCMMEGISSEAFSLAGTLGLSKLIVLYDSNQISIEGDTDIAFTEDVAKRMEAFGFQTITVEDGNDLAAIGQAIGEAKADTKRPSFIIVKTKIGYGCPAKEGKASAHGEPLGEENVSELRKTLNWPCEEAFEVPEEVYAHFKEIAGQNAKKEEQWNQLFARYEAEYPELKKLWDKYYNLDIAEELKKSEGFFDMPDQAEATRSSSGIILNRLKDIIPGLIGGAADLAPSTKTYLNGEGDFTKENYSGRNLHFGVREMAMGAVANGIALHGGLKTYVATFFVFSDYMKPMARLAALMGVPVTYVLTHDSIGVGEDGPTHEPVEQLAMLRSIPDFTVFRPADSVETAAAWYYAVSSKNRPVALILTRQNVPKLKGTSKDALKGAYIVADAENAKPDAILIATGSEVSLCLQAKEELEKKNIPVRVVSMPSMELFEEQTAEYRESILPGDIRARIIVEAASDFGWGKYAGLDGRYITVNGFGSSAPAPVLFEKYGFTVDNIVKEVSEVVQKVRK